MANMFVSGKSVSALGVGDDAQLPSQRSMSALKTSGTVPDEELKVLARFAALSPDGFDKDTLDIAKIAAVRADPQRIRAFDEVELALLARGMKRLSFVEPVRAESFPAIPSLQTEVQDLSTRTGAIDPRAPVPISNDLFKSDDDLLALRRLQRVHDADGQPTTVSLADLKAGAADDVAFIDEERAVFRRLAAVVEERLSGTNAGGDQATLVVPQPGRRSYMIPCTANEVGIRLETNVTITGQRYTLEAKREASLHIEVPKDSVVVFIHEDSHQETAFTVSSAALLPEGSYLVEVCRNGERTLGHAHVPALPKETLELGQFAGYTLVNDDNQPLAVKITPRHMLFDRFNRWVGHAAVVWHAPGDADASVLPADQIASALHLNKLPLAPGRYRRADYPLELIVLNGFAAAAEVTIDGALHRIPLGHTSAGCGGIALDSDGATELAMCSLRDLQGKAQLRVNLRIRGGPWQSVTMTQDDKTIG
jgi:hypothetical protein